MSLGAAKHRIPTLGMLDSFGTREELEEAGASWIARYVSELAAIMKPCRSPSPSP